MKILESFMPTTGGGLDFLSVFTYYILMVTFFCFVASFFFSWFTRTQVAPEHNSSRVLTAIICAVAGISYFIIASTYKDSLQQLQTITDAAQRQNFKREAFFAIGQLRYMDWLVTTPLLLIKMISILRFDYSRIKGLVALVLCGDVFMIITGYIGQQQLSDAGQVLVVPHMVWGAISTLGYLVVLYGMYKIESSRRDEKPIERRAFKLMTGTLITFWGVYPIGYILSALVPSMNTDILHIAYSVADVINKAGVGVVAYMMAVTLLESRIDEQSIEFAKNVG